MELDDTVDCSGVKTYMDSKELPASLKTVISKTWLFMTSVQAKLERLVDMDP